MEIKIQKISKSFKTSQVLDEVSFVIKSGTVCGLLGINGAGKSTLMKIIAGLKDAEQGQVFYNGETVIPKENLGALIEEPAIYKNLSAFDNLKTKALLYAIDDDQIRDILNKVGLQNAGKKRAGKFSVGMKQRLGIGMALLTKPAFLILDEPTNGLDPTGTAELLALIKELSTLGMTILLSSHQLNVISQVADQIVILDKGQIRYDDRRENVVDLDRKFFEIVHGGALDA